MNKKLTTLKLERKTVLSGLHLVKDPMAMTFFKQWLKDNRKAIMSLIREANK